MNTEAKTLHIRRGQPTDAVNIYRLIVDEEKRAGTVVTLSEGDRILDIVATIMTGYVSVATISGRIVGSIGASISDSPGVNVFVGAWFALSSSFRDTPVGQALLAGLIGAADRSGYPVKFSLHPDSPYSELLDNEGFEPKLKVWGRDVGEHEPEDSGRDEVIGDPDPADEPAPADAGADQPPAWVP